MAITEINMPAKNRVIHGSDWRSLRSDEWIQWRVKVNAAIVIDMTEEQRNKLDGLEPWRYINIPTPDFQCPDWTAQQWLNLAAFVYNEIDPESTGFNSVLVTCQGGQGRTGIAAAILRAVITEDFAAPVKAIRKFNPHFIETPAQEAYVKRIVKEIDELTKPAPAPVAPVDWPARAGKAEKRVAELEAALSHVKEKHAALTRENNSLQHAIYVSFEAMKEALENYENA